MVARRSEAVRLVIIGTYRTVEMLAYEHPLRAMNEELKNELRIVLIAPGLLGFPPSPQIVVPYFNDLLRDAAREPPTSTNTEH